MLYSQISATLLVGILITTIWVKDLFENKNRYSQNLKLIETKKINYLYWSNLIFLCITLLLYLSTIFLETINSNCSTFIFQISLIFTCIFLILIFTFVHFKPRWFFEE